MKIKTAFVMIFVLCVAMAGCRKLSEPVEVTAGVATATPIPAAQMTQTAAALQTAGLSAQQTATALSIQLTAQATMGSVALATPVLQFGEIGLDPGEFGDPADICIDAADNIYVLDASIGRVEKFTSAGVFVMQWGNTGTGNGEFMTSYYDSKLTSDSSNNIYVMDSGNDRVQKFSSTGTYIIQWGSYDYSPTVPSGLFADMRDIEVYQSNVFVLDTYYDGDDVYRVQKFDLDGNFVAAYVLTPSSLAYIYYYYMAVDSLGSWYLCTGENYMIQKLSSVFVSVAEWGTLGVDPGEILSANSICTDNSDFLYVLDYTGGKIVKYNSSGAYVKHWQFAQAFSLEALLSNYGKLAVDSGGYVYLLTRYNGIKKFAP